MDLIDLVGTRASWLWWSLVAQVEGTGVSGERTADEAGHFIGFILGGGGISRESLASI